MAAYQPPSDRARAYLLALARERVAPDLGTNSEEREAYVVDGLERRLIDKFDVMQLIDRLKDAPHDVAGTNLVPGVYQHNGTIYVVRENRTNPGIHARRLIEIGGRRLTEADTVVKIEFEYDRDALNLLRPEDQMTLAEARPFIIRYGKCIACDTPLSDARSVERGVGPVCIKRYAPEPSEPEVSDEEQAARYDRLSDLLAQLTRSR